MILLYYNLYACVCNIPIDPQKQNLSTCFGQLKILHQHSFLIDVNWVSQIIY